ncbi:hypothetical protein AOZ06_32710 [Kibdelosporangium phytohabitans]|uniref:Uncharacterized protein n=1 Tax=Kibdelosporangium phytohabitans TaxID=860235 RepID=A0A0N7F4C1_9PSEU|nr:hypothetical protein AOZ06_32710 [Kibdelosporangium phytohabitans]
MPGTASSRIRAGTSDDRAMTSVSVCRPRSRHNVRNDFAYVPALRGWASVPGGSGHVVGGGGWPGQVNGTASLAIAPPGYSRARSRCSRPAGLASSRKCTITSAPGSAARNSSRRFSSAIRSPVATTTMSSGLRPDCFNASGARKAAPIAVDPAPYGYASTDTGEPSAIASSNSARTVSMRRADVLLTWQ